ncbi:hypothetical protein NHX12_015188, partial [Muraenolepis orangiensis]
MLVDDLGIGDLGLLRQHHPKHPHYRPAGPGGGMKLTQHIAAATLCTPSRAVPRVFQAKRSPSPRWPKVKCCRTALI